MTEYFAKEDSIVRTIWGRADTVLFIFAGASAEFALNKAVDWLYFTGKLPADPIGRLFSTVEYAGKIVFAPKPDAEKAIATIAQIHKGVERSRGATIPDWAYRDVLYMLIYYSIAAFELLQRKLNAAEKEEVFDVFYRVGYGMGLQDLPDNYTAWCLSRQQHLTNDLQHSAYTTDLFTQYKKHLGPVRFAILVEAQKLVVPDKVYQLLQLSSLQWLRPSVPLYKLSKWMKLDGVVMHLLLPPAYRSQVAALNRNGK